MPPPSPETWIPLASVGRPHGVRGELRAHPFHRESALLLSLDEVLVRFPEGARAGEEHEVSLDSARPIPDAILVKLHGVDDRNAAAAVTGALLCVRRRDFPPAEEGEFYACDLDGARVRGPDGTEIGIVRTLVSYPTVDVLVVEGPTVRYEVPLLDAYVQTVDLQAGSVLLSSLDGLEPVELRSTR